MDDARLYELDVNDPNFINKQTGIKALKEINEIIDKNKEEIYSKIFYLSSLIFGILTAIFAEELNWILVLFIINISLVILIYFSRKFYKKRIKFAKEQWKIKDKLKRLGVPIID